MIDQGNLRTRKVCLLLKVKRPAPMRSEKLCASDRSGQPEITPSVIEARNLSENTCVEQTHDGSGQLDECDSSTVHTVKEQHAHEVHRVIALLTRTTSSIVKSTRRTLTSTFQDCHILP